MLNNDSSDPAYFSISLTLLDYANDCNTANICNVSIFRSGFGVWGTTKSFDPFGFLAAIVQSKYQKFLK